MSAQALLWLMPPPAPWLVPLPLHSGLGATHWLGHLAALVIIGGAWLALAGLIDRHRHHGAPPAAPAPGGGAPTGRALLARPWHASRRAAPRRAAQRRRHLGIPRAIPPPSSATRPVDAT